MEKKSKRFEQQWSSAKVVGRDFEGLTDGQQRVFDLVKQGRNVYLTGLGGTGKSYVLERIIGWARGADKNVIVCAPTGIAALNVGGSTIHRVLGIGPNKILQNPIPYIPNGSPLSECDLMPRKQRHTAKRIYHRLVREREYEGSYSSVCRYVARRRREMATGPTEGYLELVWEPGTAEVDFGNFRCVLAGTPTDMLQRISICTATRKPLGSPSVLVPSLRQGPVFLLVIPH